MSVPDQNGLDGGMQQMKHDQHGQQQAQQQQMYHQQQQQHEQHPHPAQQYYGGHYDHHQQDYAAPVHHQGYNQQQSQWYPQQEHGQQEYQYGRMTQEQQQHQYHHQIYDQIPLQQPQHPQQSDLKLEPKNESWTNTHPGEASATDKNSDISVDESMKKKSSPTKKVKKKSKVKKSKTVVKIQKILKVKNKEKKLNLNKDELAKYSDENLREVALKMKNGCDCPENCFKTFNVEMVNKHRLNIQDLTKTEHDMYIMGTTMACMGCPTERNDGKERKKQRAKYRFWGKEVCAIAFVYLENTTFYQIKSVRKHMMDHGVSPRSHGNLGKIPHNTLSLDNYQFATRFLHAYFEKHAIKDKRQKQGVIKMPKNITCKTIHEAYQAYGTDQHEPSIKLMGYSSFRGFLREQFPNLKLDGAAVTPAKHNSTASNVASSSTAASMKIEENLNSLSQ